MATKPERLTQLGVTIDCPSCGYEHTYGRHEFKTWPPTPGSTLRVTCKSHRCATPRERMWGNAFPFVTIQF